MLRQSLIPGEKISTVPYLVHNGTVELSTSILVILEFDETLGFQRLPSAGIRLVLLQVGHNVNCSTGHKMLQHFLKRICLTRLDQPEIRMTEKDLG
jgi:hypothetical protein